MNISEFAKYAGVSKSAVSRYFNDGYLSDDKKAIIEKALEETGYIPSFSAHNVRNRITKLVGVILPKLSSDSCSRVTEGINEVLYENGYQILLANTANDNNKEIEYLDLFRQNRVDGVILLATMFTETHRQLLGKMRIPVIIVGQSFKGYNCVCHDDFGAAYSLTSLMLDKGAKNPAYIGVTDDDKAAGEARHEGFLKAVGEHGLNLSSKNSAVADFNIDAGYTCAKRIFSGGNFPDCIFCATDNIAAGAMLYCKENNIKIPYDVMICGIGDSKIGAITAVSLTSARFHYKAAGIEAANMLLSSLEKPDNIPKTLCLDYEIIERESTNKLSEM